MQKMNSYIKDFKKLTVWQKAIAIIPDVNNIVSKFPDWENYALKCQLVKSTYSISGNVNAICLYQAP